MFDNDFETAINFYFFLKESEYVFSQFVTTVGKTDPDTGDRKSTRLNSSHITRSRMPSSA